MAEFQDILTEFETRSADAPAANRYDPFVSLPPRVSTSQMVRSQDALGAYLRVAAGEANEQLEKPLEPVDLGENFSRELAAARLSARRLKSLRRDVAWLLHPDRRPGDPAAAAAMLAHFNAEIDAALAALNVRE